ncbi:unnamed protein product [Thelazia callipaeda]|uniref:Uncharacterized protein n=1 Tax=Thelazia callipaeda TaxID=103827 RepID=A0A0N5CUE9_THECL|nr:unnamed protein product [Thelazia callipaeda]
MANSGIEQQKHFMMDSSLPSQSIANEYNTKKLLAHNVPKEKTIINKQQRSNIGNILWRAMQDRRCLVHFESSTSSDDDENEQDSDVWSEEESHVANK